MNARITRRQALAAGVGVLVGPTLSAAPVPNTAPNPSWVGKTVLPRKYATAGYFLDPAPPGETPLELSVTLHAASYDVEAEKGSRVEVFHENGTTLWVEKANLVQLADAVEFFTKAIKENEKDTFALVSCGWAFYLLGKPKDAIKDFDEFLKLTPGKTGQPERWEGLVARGLVLAEQGEFEKALKDLNESIEDSPHVVIAYVNRGYARELMGEYKTALADYYAALAVSGSHALAANNLAWTLATCPDAKLRDGAEAVSLAKQVCDRMKDREAMYLDTLAAAYAEVGKFDDAVKAQEKALLDKAYAAKYGDGGQKRLQLYKDKKPFRTEPVKK